MTKYTFIMQDDDYNFMGANGNKVEYNIDCVDEITHVELAYHFRQFLEGCGYVFPQDFEMEL